ncbi:MAG TPA: hypothetical protein VMZ91_02895 [Candidatus Paceibacterota bacterium]|nr:hypothetical protein [Candidatus Paceibacterota bacterium]
MIKMIIKKENLRYKCNFCGKLFMTLTECAKHIEKESVTGVIFPSDILIVDITDEPNQKRVQLYFEEPEEEYQDLRETRKKKKYRKVYKRGGHGRTKKKR